MTERPPLRVFLSYSSQDRALVEALRAHLIPLVQRGLIVLWYDREIAPGREFDGIIRTELEQADLVLFLLSSDFVASDYCMGVEVTRAMARHAAGEARVIPIYLRPVHLDGTLFVDLLNGLPDRKRPVAEWENRDSAFEAVAAGIERAVDDIHRRVERGRTPPGHTKTGSPGPRRWWRAVGALLAVLVLVAAAGYWWPRHLFDRGLQAYEAGAWEPAGEAFKRAAAFPFSPPEAFWGLGLLAERDGRLDEALGYYRAAIAADDEDWRFALAEGALQERTGREQQAIRTLRPLLEREPGVLAAYPHLAVALRLGGELEQAEYYQAEAARRSADAAIWTREENRAYWIFPTAHGPVELRGTAAKRAWLAADHALTLFLLGREQQAQAQLADAEDELAQTPEVFAANIRGLLAYQLARLDAARPEWTQRIEDFRVRFEVPRWPE